MVLLQLQQKNMGLMEQMKDLLIRIHALWDRLELEETERQEFEARLKGHKQGVLAGLRQEVDRGALRGPQVCQPPALCGRGTT